MIDEPGVGTARIVTACIKGTSLKDKDVSARIALMEKIVTEIRSCDWASLDALVLPGGFFYQKHQFSTADYQGRRVAMENTSFSKASVAACKALSRKSPGILIISGVDGPEGQQFCVAWRTSGIVGIAKKIFRTAHEANAGLGTCFEDYRSSKRLVEFRGGRKAVLCSCYDMFGITETPNRLGRRTSILQTIERDGQSVVRGQKDFKELRLRCIQQWDLLMRTNRPSVGIAAIHNFQRPGLDGFWQRHGIATASAALDGGLAIAAGHFKTKLPEMDHSTLAAAAVGPRHLGNAGHRKAHRLMPQDGFYIDRVALVRLFQSQ